ncbi:MAG TPA: signal peptide peptidase SppA [Bryobacteraceae bacterium]|jgi:protease-4|nr:signal peptide peptidase SppA [Bryobacteraceae bacterium]
MAKFLFGLITGVILCVVALFLIFFALARSFRESAPAVAQNSVLQLQLSDDIPERAPVEVPFGALADRSASTVTGIWLMLREAAVDGRIKAVALEPQSLSVGWGKLEEFRADLERFKRSGKPLYAFLKTPGAREYYLASVADRVYLGPTDWLDLKGMRVETMYFKKTLDKLGVSVQVEHDGKYKDFGDMFTRTSMSPETREVLTSVVDDLYGNELADIAHARKKNPDDMRTLVDQGPFLANDAVHDGLVDELRYEDQMFSDLQQKVNFGELHKISSGTYQKIPAESLGLTGHHRIAMMVGDGTITRGSANDDGVSDEGIQAGGFNRQLRRIASDSSVDGVVVRIDSPGGDAVASDEIWREMNLLSKKKPLVISMSDTAASGGYYMAMTGDPVVAYPGTLTGSIGVVFGKPDLHGLYDKLGIDKDTISRGRFENIDSDYTTLSPAELAKLKEGIDANYHDFVAKVAQARHRPFDQIEPLAQGRVWLGDQAKSNGLVDELGGIERALELVKQKARIPASENVTIVMYPPRRSILDVLFGRAADSMTESRLERLLKAWPPELWAHGGLFRIMPFTLTAR